LREQPSRSNHVKDENCERVDSHSQQTPLGPEDQARKVDARQQDGEPSEVNIGVVGLRQNRLTRNRGFLLNAPER